MRELNSFFLSIALIGLLLQPMCEVWIVVQYQARKDFISKTLCEKRGIALNTCQGRCYLKKQLAKSKEAQQKQQIDSKSLLNKEYPPHQYTFAFQQVVSEIEIHLNSKYQITDYESMINPAFHPPPARV